MWRSEIKIKDCKGQSVAEYAVVLALIVIIAVTVLMGIGQSTRDRLSNVNAVNTAFDGGTSAAPAGGSSNQVNKASGTP